MPSHILTLVIASEPPHATFPELSWFLIIVLSGESLLLTAFSMYFLNGIPALYASTTCLAVVEDMNCYDTGWGLLLLSIRDVWD
jgi:hypothetical protein